MVAVFNSSWPLYTRIRMIKCLSSFHIRRIGAAFSSLAIKPSAREIQEVQIPVPWGHIAGKWWGPQNVQPVLCIHGYQDNAASWDNLLPLLPPELSFLAIDLPGHGLSSHLPRGQPYYILDFVACIHRIAKHFGYEKVSLLSHSLGSITGFFYSSLFPDNVEHYISLDAFKPVTIDPPKRVIRLSNHMAKFLELDALDGSSRTSYTYEEAFDRLHEAMKKMASRDACEILMKRGLHKLENGRYCFIADSRLKASIEPGFTQDYLLAFASNVKCKVLNIKAKDGLKFGTPEQLREFCEMVKISAQKYEYVEVEGRHHVHLDIPENVAPVISKFLLE